MIQELPIRIEGLRGMTPFSLPAFAPERPVHLTLVKSHVPANILEVMRPQDSLSLVEMDWDPNLPFPEVRSLWLQRVPKFTDAMVPKLCQSFIVDDCNYTGSRFPENVEHIQLESCPDFKPDLTKLPPSLKTIILFQGIPRTALADLELAKGLKVANNLDRSMTINFH